jgi:hypothetical protein
MRGEWKKIKSNLPLKVLKGTAATEEKKENEKLKSTTLAEVGRFY